MAPGLTESLPSAQRQFSDLSPAAIFPDGIKTSGQHPPLYHELCAVEEFPHGITGPTVWKAEDYTYHPERWVHSFTEEEIVEMSEAADGFIDAGIPLTGISKVGGEQGKTA